jgi:hypothetical protein
MKNPPQTVVLEFLVAAMIAARAGLASEGEKRAEGSGAP